MPLGNIRAFPFLKQQLFAYTISKFNLSLTTDYRLYETSVTVTSSPLHYTTSLLSEVCHGVSNEPHLQPLTRETFHLLQLLLKKVQDWMLLQVVFGEVTIRRSSLMLRCLRFQFAFVISPIEKGEAKEV